MIDNLHFAVEGAWRVLAAGLVFGAGLPLVFALGIRSLAGASGEGASVATGVPPMVGRALAAVCLVVVLAGVALGITIVAAAGFGREVSFEHGYPTIITKEG